MSYTYCWHALWTVHTQVWQFYVRLPLLRFLRLCYGGISSCQGERCSIFGSHWMSACLPRWHVERCGCCCFSAALGGQFSCIFWHFTALRMMASFEFLLHTHIKLDSVIITLSTGLTSFACYLLAALIANPWHQIRLYTRVHSSQLSRVHTERGGSLVRVLVKPKTKIKPIHAWKMCANWWKTNLADNKSVNPLPGLTLRTQKSTIIDFYNRHISHLSHLAARHPTCHLLRSASPHQGGHLLRWRLCDCESFCDFFLKQSSKAS